MAQLMPLPRTVSCFSKIQIGFAFLVPAHPGSPGQRAVKQVCVCMVYGNAAIRCYTHTHTRLKPIWILLKQETVSGSGISWAYASLHLAPDR